jgi:hypothetical protein
MQRRANCPYCRQEHLYLEQDRIEFDTENGLPLINRADFAQAVGWCHRSGRFYRDQGHSVRG